MSRRQHVDAKWWMGAGRQQIYNARVGKRNTSSRVCWVPLWAVETAFVRAVGSFCVRSVKISVLHWAIRKPLCTKCDAWEGIKIANLLLFSREAVLECRIWSSIPHTHKECFQKILNKISVIICHILINQAFIKSDMQGSRFLSFKLSMRGFLKLHYRKGKWFATYDLKFLYVTRFGFFFFLNLFLFSQKAHDYTL